MTKTSSSNPAGQADKIYPRSPKQAGQSNFVNEEEDYIADPKILLDKRTYYPTRDLATTQTFRRNETNTKKYGCR